MICIWVPRNFVRVPILLLMLVPYAVWIQRLGDQGFFWSLIRPDMATGEGYFDAPADRGLAAALVACNFYEDPPNCDFPKIDALARAANVNAIGRRDKTFVDLALGAGAFPEVVRSLLRAGGEPRATRGARRCTTRAAGEAGPGPRRAGRGRRSNLRRRRNALRDSGHRDAEALRRSSTRAPTPKPELGGHALMEAVPA
jgi:hypothetical protein